MNSIKKYLRSLSFLRAFYYVLILSFIGLNCFNYYYTKQSRKRYERANIFLDSAFEKDSLFRELLDELITLTDSINLE